MGYLEGLLGGFTERKGVVEDQNRQEALAGSDRERRVLESLINSPDPEVKSLAVAGLLDSAGPKKRKGGLSGWLGELQGSPHLQSIRDLIAHDAQGGGSGEPPAVAPEGASARPTQAITGTSPASSAAPLAQPTGSPTEVGGPPPTPTTTLGAPVEPAPGAQPPVNPSLFQASPGPTTRGQEIQAEAAKAPTPGTPPPAESGPPTGPSPLAVLGTPAPPISGAQPGPGKKGRQVFQTPEGQVRLSKKAAAQGDVEGDVAGYVAAGLTQEQAVAQVQAERIRRSGGVATGYQSVAGEVVDAEGKVIPTFAVLDKASGQYKGTDPDSPYYGIPIPGFRPKATGAGANPFYGQDREAIARAVYGVPFSKLTPEQAADVNGKRQSQLQEDAVQRGTGSGIATFNKPIGVGEAQRTNTQVGATSAQYAGQAVPSTAEQDQRRGVESVKSQLQHVSTLIGAALPKANELSGLAPGATLAIRRRSPQYRTQIAQLESALDNVVNVLARTVGQQRGAQTEMDATRAYNTVVSMKARLLDPTAGDTVESATARIQETMKYLETVLASLPATPVAAAGAGAVGVGSAPPAPGGPAPASPATPAPAAAAPAPGAAPGAKPATPGSAPASAPAGPAGMTMVNGKLYLNGKPY